MVVLANQCQRRSVISGVDKEIGYGWRIRRAGSCIRRDGPSAALASTDGIAGDCHQAGRRARRRQTAGWPHGDLVLRSVIAKVEDHFAIPAEGEDVAEGNEVQILVPARHRQLNSLPVVAGWRRHGLRTVDGTVRSDEKSSDRLAVQTEKVPAVGEDITGDGRWAVRRLARSVVIVAL